MKVYRGAESQWLSLLNSAMYRDEWPVSRFGRLTPTQKAPKNIFKDGWVGHKVNLGDVENSIYLAPSQDSNHDTSDALHLA